jgi:hypothetical protein
MSKPELYASLFVCLVALTCCLAGSGPAVAQESLPTGETVMQNYIDATGGQQAWDKIRNRYTEATLEIVNAGLRLDIKSWTAKPNLLFVESSSEALGTILKGCTGDVVWSMSQMQGPVIEQGFASESQRRDLTFDRLVYWSQCYESAQCVALESIGDRPHYKVVLKPRPFDSEDAGDFGSAEVTVWFDSDSGLASQIQSNTFSSAGTIPVTAVVSDYREMDGVLIPFQTSLQLAGQKRIMTIQKVRNNIQLDDGRFDPPPEIQALLASQTGR